MSAIRSIQDAALAVVTRLREQGHQALWAGGCVRDMLLGLDPTDVDVATDATPDRIVALFRRTRPVGMQFGVVLVKQGGHWIETATFRTDVNYEDGRRPEHVVFTTPQEDAQRRDFTINGLFYDPLGKQIIDYVDGQTDIQGRLIRAIGDPDLRFSEDHLRLLRAMRFSARFDFAIEPQTGAAIRRHGPSLVRISPERICEELEKMLVHPTRAKSVQMIQEYGLLGYLWPDARWAEGQIERAAAALGALPPAADLVLAMAAMLFEYPLNEVRRIGRALRCSNDEVQDMAWLVQNVDLIEQTEILCLPEFKRLLAHRRCDDLLSLHEAICVARGMSLDANRAARGRRAAVPPDQIAPPPFVTGDDLIAAGLEPGPLFGEILDTLYDEQLDNRLTSREQSLAKMKLVVTQLQQDRS